MSGGILRGERKRVDRVLITATFLLISCSLVLQIVDILLTRKRSRIPKNVLTLSEEDIIKIADQLDLTLVDMFNSLIRKAEDRQRKRVERQTDREPENGRTTKPNTALEGGDGIVDDLALGTDYIHKLLKG